MSPKRFNPIRMNTDTSDRVRYPSNEKSMEVTSELLHLMPSRIGSSPKMMTPQKGQSEHSIKQIPTQIFEIDQISPLDRMNLTQQSVEGLLEQLQMQN